MTIKLLIISLITLLIYSCTQSKSLWNNHEYVEHVTHILSSENGEKIIISGEKYHYVFINQYTLSELIKWSHNDLLGFKFKEHFKLSPQNIVTGNYTVICKCNNASPEQIRWLTSKGFNKINDNKHTYYRDDSISGAMYLSNNVDLSKYEKNNEKYKITIESRHAFDTTAKIIFTPVTIVGDVGTAAIYGSALIIASPFISLDYNTKTNHTQ